MGIPLPRPAALNARLDLPIEEWPYLDEAVLLKTRSRKVCMTCHWFRHHAGVNCIPVLTCRCQGWTDDMTRQQGWQPCAPQWLPPAPLSQGLSCCRPQHNPTLLWSAARSNAFKS